MSRRSAVDHAFETLQAHVLHGSWRPGDKVPTESALTEQLGVSRTTVREALNRLASSGLIVAPHSGTRRVADFRDRAGLEVLAELVVSPAGQVDLSVVRAVTEMRQALAPDMARLAALRADGLQRDTLVALADALVEDAPLEPLLEATLEWWTTLVHGSHNLAYRLAYNTLRSTYMDGRALLMGVIEAELRAVDLYRSISAAVARGDSTAAQQDTAALVGLGSSAIFAAIEGAV